MNSTSYRIAILLSVLILLTALIALGTETDEPQTDQVTDRTTDRTNEAPSRSLLSITGEQALNLKPIDQEIRVLLIKEREDIAVLTALLKKTHDNMRALQIQKDIGAKKQQAEIGIMEVQAKYARQAGREEQATAISEAVAGMKERLAASQGDTGIQE
jgi:hypothetical protein